LIDWERGKDDFAVSFFVQGIGNDSKTNPQTSLLLANSLRWVQKVGKKYTIDGKFPLAIFEDDWFLSWLTSSLGVCH
jgi:hypothetical protein